MAAGCSVVDDRGPVAAAQEWMSAVARMDGNRAAALTCDESQDSMLTGGAILSVLQIFSGQLLGQEAELDVSDLEYTLISQDGDRAVVRIAGTMRAAILMASQGEPIDEDVTMVREDGAWLVCD
jgi:hypothetical protein